MADDPLYAIPGTQRSRSQVDAIVARLLRILDETPGDPAARGALAAATWTLRKTPITPMSAQHAFPSRNAADAEAGMAADIVHGHLPGDQPRAYGVRAWLGWWTGEAAAPGWMLPTLARR